MFISRALVNQIVDRINELFTKSHDAEYNLGRIEADNNSNHNDQEEQINKLKADNARLREDLDALARALNAEFVTYSPQPERRSVVIHKA